jgi:hypothetical protein
MRKLVYGMLTSLDLYVEGPDGRFGRPTPDADLHRYFNERAAFNPVAVGGGKRFFTDLTGQIDLTLLGVQTFSGGVVQLRYQPKRPVM